MPRHISYIPKAEWAFDALRVLEITSLEHTRVVNGMFLDYYGLPHWRSYPKPWVNAVNVQRKWAVIPGHGEIPVSFITTQDLGRFVARLMDFEEWPRVSCFVGVTTSFYEILELAEAPEARTKGNRDTLTWLMGVGDKYMVKYEDFKTLHRRVAATGGYFVLPDKALDHRFPDVKVTTAEEVLNV